MDALDRLDSIPDWISPVGKSKIWALFASAFLRMDVVTANADYRKIATELGGRKQSRPWKACELQVEYRSCELKNTMQDGFSTRIFGDVTLTLPQAHKLWQ